MFPQNTTGHGVIVGQGKGFDITQKMFRQDVGSLGGHEMLHLDHPRYTKYIVWSAREDKILINSLITSGVELI
jgi:hypothetical protein